MSLAIVRFVELLDVPPIDPMHRLTEVRQWSLDEQVVMVSHQAVGVANETVARTCSLDQAKKSCSIFIAHEDRSSQVSPTGDVVKAVRPLIPTSRAHAPEGTELEVTCLDGRLPVA
jgi:hypothetical protein